MDAPLCVVIEINNNSGFDDNAFTNNCHFSTIIAIDRCQDKILKVTTQVGVIAVKMINANQLILFKQILF